MRVSVLGFVLGTGFLLGSGVVGAAEPLSLVLKDGQFSPREVKIGAGERFRIEVHNQGSGPAEFESPDMRIEKVIVPGGKIIVSAGPLKPGTYKFYDEYHPEAAGIVRVE